MCRILKYDCVEFPHAQAFSELMRFLKISEKIFQLLENFIEV